MKKLFAFATLFFFGGVYLIATIPEFTKKMIESGVITNPRDYGDLYYFSHLPDFEKLKSYIPYSTSKLHATKKVKLFILGDSFTKDLPAEYFCSNEYLFTHWEDQREISLDTSCINILLLESVERLVRVRFGPEQQLNNILVKKGGDPNKSELTTFYADSRMTKFYTRVFGQGIIETNLGLLLFENFLARRIKNLKAYINLHVFERIDDAVVLSNKIHELYLAETVKPQSIMSSFNHVSDKEVADITANIDKATEYYHNRGFNKVIVSFIPNKVSIQEPNDNYNHLLERIQSNGNVRFEYIDAYNMLKLRGGLTYFFNDTHWNSGGMNPWLDSLNAEVKMISAQDNVPNAR